MKPKIETTVIIYRMDGVTCATPCPFLDLNKRGLGKRVGSWACEQCEHFVANDRKRQTLVCSHPGKAVFCKKDRKLNEEMLSLKEWAVILANHPELAKQLEKMLPSKPIE